MNHRARRFRRTALGCLLTVALAACSASPGAPSSSVAPSSAPSDAASGSPASRPSAEPTAAATVAATRTVETETGPVEITGIPERIVVLEWGYLDMLYALGVEPTGLADIKGYNQWVGAGPRPAEDVVDVGLRGEPSLETVAGLDPDLIIDESWGYDYVPQLQALAPTLIYYPYPKDGTSQLERMDAAFRSIGTAVGKPAEADQVLADLDAHIEEARAEIAAAGKAGTRFTFIQAWGVDDPGIRIFTKDSMVSQVLERLGLVNAWEDAGDYGFSDGSVEAIATVEDASMFYIVQADDDPITTRIQEDPVWSALAFAKEERYYSLGGDAWTFGGPLSLTQIVDRVVEHLAG